MTKPKLLLWVVLLAPSALLRLYPAMPLAADEKVFAAASKMIAGGALLYRDVFDHKGPALYWSFNALQSLTGSYWGVRLGTILAAMAMQVAVFWIVLGLLRGRRVVERRQTPFLHTVTALFLPLPSLAVAGPSLASSLTTRRPKPAKAVARLEKASEAPPSTAESAAFWAALAIGIGSWLTNRIFGVELFMLAPVAVSLALILHDRGLWADAIAGLLIGYAVMVKPTAAADAFMLASVALLAGSLSVGRVFVIVTAALVAVGFFLRPFYEANALADLQRVLFGFNAYYSRERPFTPEIAVWLAKQAALCFFLWLPPLFMLRARSGDPSRRVILALAAWSALALGLSLMARRPFNHYLLEPYLPMSILLGLWLARVRVRAPFLLRPPAALGWLGALGLFGFAHATILRAPEREYAYSERRVAALADALTKPGNKLYVWGNAANVYFYSQRPAAMKYIFYPPFRGRYGGAAPAFEQEYWRDWVAAFDRAKPSLIVDCSQTKWNDLPWLNPYLNPALADRLESEYRIVTVVEGFRIFQRKAAMKARPLTAFADRP